jgi:Isochorismatase family
MVEAKFNQALLVVDIQNDFMGQQAKMPIDQLQTDEIIENINKLRECFSQRNNPSCFTIGFVTVIQSNFSITDSIATTYFFRYIRKCCVNLFAPLGDFKDAFNLKLPDIAASPV